MTNLTIKIDYIPTFNYQSQQDQFVDILRKAQSLVNDHPADLRAVYSELNSYVNRDGVWFNAGISGSHIWVHFTGVVATRRERIFMITNA